MTARTDKRLVKKCLDEVAQPGCAGRVGPFAPAKIAEKVTKL
jgi:hypothetical protein